MSAAGCVGSCCRVASLSFCHFLGGFGGLTIRAGIGAIHRCGTVTRFGDILFIGGGFAIVSCVCPFGMNRIITGFCHGSLSRGCLSISSGSRS